MATLVVFTADGARVLKNPPDEHVLMQQPNVLVNPDLKHLYGIPPHEWAIDNGKVVQKTGAEERLTKVSLPVRLVKLKPYILAAVGLVVGILIGKLVL